jgi:hypothetical protein
MLATLVGCTVQAGSSSQNPDRMVREFYEQYARYDRARQHQRAASYALENLTPDLARLVREAERRNRAGEMILDFDYVDTQDSEGFKSLVVRTISAAPDRALVGVSFEVAGEKRGLKVELRRVGDRLRIANFDYSGRSTLVSVLTRA